MKIKSLVKRFFRGWIPVEPKMSDYWSRNKLGITLFVSLSIIVASIITFEVWNLSGTTQIIQPLPLPELPTLKSGYYPGVSVGDYGIYGNYVCIYDHNARGEDVVCNNDLAFCKVEVISVSGSEVTFLYTAEYKNGSETPLTGCTETLDVEAAWWSNNTEYYIDYSLIIAANLTEGSCIHARGKGGVCDVPDHQVMKIEERTYLGSSRNVIPLYYSHGESGDNYNVTYNEVTVYDQESGIKLEKSITSDGNLVWAMSIIETNIFPAPKASPEASMQENSTMNILFPTPYVAAGVAFIMIFVATIVILRKRMFKGGENENEQQFYS